MKFIFLFLVAFIPFSTKAEVDQRCQELKAEQVRLALTAANLSNINTTRTPEGGPYRAFIISSCSNGGCDVKRDERAPVMKYLPDHPDANENGYVAFPNIDQKAESAIFNMTALKLKLLVRAHACGAKVISGKGDSSFVLRYEGKGAANVKEDVFNIDTRSQVISWMRQDLKGAVSVIHFSSSGEVHSQF